MLLDIIGISLLVLFFIRGYRKGIIVALLSVVGLVLGVVVSLKLSGALAGWLHAQDIAGARWALLISYVLLFVGVILLVRLIARLLEGSIKSLMLGPVNGLVGGLLYSLLAAFAWSALLWLAHRVHLLDPDTLAGSVTYSWFAPVAPRVVSLMGSLLPFAEGILAELESLFDDFNKKLPGYVGTD